MSKGAALMIGTHEGFRVEVKPDWDDPNQWSITFWRRNHGDGLPCSLTSEAKAVALGQHLYDQLFPEFVAAEKRQKESMRRYSAEMAARPKRKPPTIPKKAPILDVLICGECCHLILLDDVSDERVYECSRCNQTTSGDDARRCEQCNIFTSKISDTSCPDCGAAMDDAEKGHAQRATNKELVRYFTPEELAQQEAERKAEQVKRDAAQAKKEQEIREGQERARRLFQAISIKKIKTPIGVDGNELTIEFEDHKYVIREER